MAKEKAMYQDNKQTGSLLDGMDTSNKNLQNIGVELLTVHTEGTVHAKRMSGTFRKAKWLFASLWISLFTFPYLQWSDRQAILFDLSERQFHIFGLTLLPQDIWVLSLGLLLGGLLLAASTAIAGRLWCGYFCFQTVWADVFAWIEEKIEGLPNKRVKLDKEPMSLKKLKLKIPKWIAWSFIGFMTAFSFVAYFTPALDLWVRMFAFEWTGTETIVILSLAFATTFFAGFLREQTCIGFCPYARIQGAMIDVETILPTYDVDRGEPRGRIKRVKEGEEPSDLGDCIDCNLCVAVCPTGVDIRKGQQFGCITCGICIDACDSIMEKIKKPKGLIRYASLAEFEGKPAVALFKRPRVLTYSGIMVVATMILIWGVVTMSPLDVTVLHNRAPLFVQMSSGDIQNKYALKIVNKNTSAMEVSVTVEGHEGLVYIVNDVVAIAPGKVASATLFVRIHKKHLTELKVPIYIHVKDLNNPEVSETSRSVFFAPKKR